MATFNIPLMGFRGFNASNRRKRFGVGSLIIVMLVGLGLLGSGFALYRASQIDESWVTTQGEIVDIATRQGADRDITYTPVIEYSVEGEDYLVTSSTGSTSAPRLGQSREVTYNPASPAEAKVTGESTIWFALLFGIIGAGMIIGAPIAYIRSKKRTKDIASLKQTGQKVDGVVVDIQTLGSSSTSRRRNRIGNSGLARASNNSYRVVVAAADQNGNTKQYVSDSMEGLGGIAMINFQQNPIPVSVYIDPLNPDNYYVDIESLPGLTPQRITEMFQSAVGGQQAPQTPAQPPTTMQAAPTQQTAPPQFNQPMAPNNQNITPTRQEYNTAPSQTSPTQQATPQHSPQAGNTINPQPQQTVQPQQSSAPPSPVQPASPSGNTPPQPPQ